MVVDFVVSFPGDPAEQKQQSRMDRLMSLLELASWTPRESRMILTGLDPECPDKVGSWRVLPGLDPDIDEDTVDDCFIAVRGLRLKTGTPINIIAEAIYAGILIPWEHIVAADPVLQQYLPVDRRVAVNQLVDGRLVHNVAAENIDASVVSDNKSNISDHSSKGGQKRAANFEPSYRWIESQLEVLRSTGFAGCWTKGSRGHPPRVKASTVTDQLSLDELPKFRIKGRLCRLSDTRVTRHVSDWIKENMP